LGKQRTYTLQIHQWSGKEKKCRKRIAVKTLAKTRINYIKRIYKRIAKLTGKSTSNLSSVHQTEEAEDGITIYNPDEIDHQVKKNNIIHFAQAKDTPLSKVGYPLQENYISEPNEPTLNQQSRQILQILSGKRMDPIKPLIEMESWKKKFSKWRERTATLPSGLHIGHYKALLTTYYLETDTECHVDQDLKKIQDELLETSLTIVNMAIKTQISLTRWKRVGNIIIPKKNTLDDWNT
jgi:hypothetical protein